jgi:thiamine biosynthesis lipoprotein
VSATTLPHGVALAGAGPWQRRTHDEHVWGTVVTFDVRGQSLEAADAAVEQAVDVLHQVDADFSTYRADSAVTLLRNGILPPHRIPAAVHEVLEACERARALTLGAFDPWAVPGGVDPSGYVKGWAAERAAELLVAAGLDNVCVNASGDIACRGEQAPGEPWTVGILDPRDTTRVVHVVEVRDGAVATSGLYERGAHVVDPASGRREVRCDSATVVGPDAGLADALATAALVAGEDAASWFAELPGWSLLLVRGDELLGIGPAAP